MKLNIKAILLIICILFSQFSCEETNNKSGSSKLKKAVANLKTDSTKILRMKSLIHPNEINYNELLGSGFYLHFTDTLDGQKVYNSYTTHLQSRMDIPEDADHTFDHDILDYTTMRPLAKHLNYGSLLYDYSKKDTVGVTFITRKDTLKKEIHLKTHNYNLSGPAAGLITANLFLKVGLKTTFSRIKTRFPYDLSKKNIEIVEYMLEVVGEEIIEVGTNSYSTYIIEIYPINNEAGLFYKQWVTKNSPHLSIQFIYTHTRNRTSNNPKIFKDRKIMILK